jgi:hypothetical protein
MASQTAVMTKPDWAAPRVISARSRCVDAWCHDFRYFMVASNVALACISPEPERMTVIAAADAD